MTPKRDKKAYLKLREDARDLYVRQAKTQKEIAYILSVTEKTVSDWATEGDWRTIRNARQSSASTARENIERIIALLSSRRLEIETSINAAKDASEKELEIELRKQANNISDDMSKANKTLAELNKDSRINLGMYIDIQEDIFAALRTYDPKLYQQSLGFQASHIRNKSNELL